MAYTFTTTGRAADHAEHVWEGWNAYLSSQVLPDGVTADDTGICCHTCEMIVVDRADEIADEAPAAVEPLPVSNVKPWYFRKIYDNARADSPTIREATSEYDTSPAARGTRYFLWSDGADHAGFAIRADGELVYVFSTTRGMGARLVAAAISRGATHLDCFDGYLVTLYTRGGFHRVTSLPNWTDGAPAVVYMALPSHFLRALDKAERA